MKNPPTSDFAAPTRSRGLKSTTARIEPVQFLTGPDVQARYRKSHVTIWRWVNDPNLAFPKPIQINRLNYWKLSDLEAWEAAQSVAA
jgi:predicted DNA-binding transcriptional regulator AlpA